ncbi:MAG: hypothetical protein ACTSPV_10150 [Candidatus Hodarchaeales archaeon]
MSEILEFGHKQNLGSTKTILALVNSLVESKFIKVIEIPNDGPGRPKKAFARPDKGSDEIIQINLALLPSPLRSFIDNESQKQSKGKSEIITQFLVWSFLFYQNGLDSIDNLPKEPLPDVLKENLFSRDSLRSLKSL